MCFFGPFQIEERIAAVAYHLKLPETAKLYHVFHVSWLKRFKGSSEQFINPLPANFIDQHPLLTPRPVVKYQDILHGSQVVPQVLVHWEGQQESDATWEDTQAFKDTFPEFALEDKGVVNRGPIDAQGSAGDTNAGTRRSNRKNQGVKGVKFTDFVMG